MTQHRGQGVTLVSLCLGLTGMEIIFPSYLPKADCENCLHKEIAEKYEHCYMFEHAPGEFCGQFKNKTLESA